ncbi:hypothetical protein SAMN05421636_10841 [Pricia antarctica]|uniref:Membrane dipeptidase (Peptidase family M19) n=1 Tax=Pricia antarctica TaxID=641691 RepID=A0A1G7GA50_9FLAO|nr:hypothetical protein [Pricia antarctica]SDE85024.1 hypothetical protein SAMN05421636_10841 [Pricia antarctica]
MDNYFDLHFHPVSKNHLARYNDDISTKRDIDELTKAIEMSKAFKDLTDETILHTLESQCCIDYLKGGKVSLGVAAIAALEFGVASSKGFFFSLLKSNLTLPFSKHYFDVVREGQVSYLNLFLREVEQYRALKESGVIAVLNRKNIHKLNEKSLNLTFAIEGGHNLCMKKIGNALKYDEFKNFDKSAVFDPKTVASKNPATVLEELVKTFREKDLEVLYLTLTHLTHIPEQHLATHAFATKALKHPSFYPFGNGISELGLEVIDKAYSLGSVEKDGPDKNKDKVSNPVLIDITHMSLKSRLDFYKYRKDKGYENIPIIASHVGVTGYSINDWKDNLDNVKCVNHVDQGIKTVKMYTTPKVAGYWGSDVKTQFTFNPNTLNLMDEDIIAVVNSKGIIGVSLDVRILGYESRAMPQIDTSEFITTSDFMTHFPYTSIQSFEYANAEEIQSEEAWLKPVKKEMHPLSFCFNIVHLLAVIGLKATPKMAPEKYICVGSDFDGFIEPLKICSDSRHMKELESNLLKWLPVAAKRYQKENGGTADLFEFAKKKEVLKKVVKAILYENGREFIANEFVSERAEEKKREPAK